MSEGMLATCWLSFRRVLGGRRLWLVALFLAVPIVLTAMVHYGKGFPARDPKQRTLGQAIYLFMLYPQVISILLTLLYGSSLLNAEIEGKTITYLFTRPLAKWRVVAGIYAGIVSILAPGILGSFLVSWLILAAPGGGSFVAGFGLAVMLAVLAYTAVFALIGILVPRRGMMLGLIFALIFEIALGFVPVLANRFSVAFYLRSLAIQSIKLQLPPEFGEIVKSSSLLTAVTALALIAAGALAATSWIATRRELQPVEQV